jgi:hypothetical protein
MSLERHMPPLWWRSFAVVFELVVNIDYYLAWLPGWCLLRLVDWFWPSRSSAERSLRSVYIQVFLQPQVYAVIVYIAYKFLQIDWRVLALFVTFYLTSIFLFQYRKLSQWQLKFHFQNRVHRDAVMGLRIIKAMAAVWAFFVASILFAIP